MRNLPGRVKTLEKALQYTTATFDLIVVRAGESQEQAIERAGNPEGAAFMLIIDIENSLDESAIDRQIEAVIEDLKKKGLSDADIESIIAEA
jgi:hypothetical protein